MGGVVLAREVLAHADHHLGSADELGFRVEVPLVPPGHRRSSVDDAADDEATRRRRSAVDRLAVLVTHDKPAWVFATRRSCCIKTDEGLTLTRLSRRGHGHETVEGTGTRYRGLLDRSRPSILDGTGL